MATPNDSAELTYQLRKPFYVQKGFWQRVTVVVAVGLAAVLAWRVWPAIWDRIQFQKQLRECQNFKGTTGEIAFTNDAVQSTALRGSRTGYVPMGLTAVGKPAMVFRPMDERFSGSRGGDYGTLFLEERTSSDGVRRLVHVRIVDAASTRIRFQSMVVWSEGFWSKPVSWDLMENRLIKGQKVTFFYGIADGFDSSLFHIPYEIDGEKKRMTGRLEGNGFNVTLD